MAGTAVRLWALSLAVAGLCTAICLGEEPPAAPPGAPDSPKPVETPAILLAVSDSQGEVLVADAKGTVAVLDLDKGGRVRTKKWSCDAVCLEVTDEKAERKISLYASPLSVSGGRTTVLRGRRVIEYEGEKERILREDAGLEGCNYLLRSEQGDGLLAGSTDGRLVAFGDDGKAYGRRQGVGSQGPAALSGDGRLTVVASKGEAWDVLALPMLEPATHLTDVLGYPPVLGFAISRDGRSVAVSHGVVCRLKVFPVSEKGVVGTLRGAFKVDSPCLTMAFDSRGERLVLGHLDGTVRVVDALRQEGESSRMLKERGSWKDHAKPVRGVTFCRAGAALLSLAEDGEVIARSWPEGKVLWKVNAFAPK